MLFDVEYGRRNSWLAGLALLACAVGVVLYLSDRPPIESLESLQSPQHESALGGAPAANQVIPERSQATGHADSNSGFEIESPQEARNREWSNCVRILSEDRSNEIEVRACLRATFEDRPPTTDELSQWFCHSGGFDMSAFLIVSEAVHSWAPEEALQQLDVLYGHCSRTQMGGLAQQCIQHVYENDAAWTERFVLGVTPRTVFDPSRSVAGVLILGQLIKAGRKDLEPMLLAGAQGEWGGTPWQMDRAIHLAFGTIEENPAARVAFLDQVLHSPHIREDEVAGLGATLVCLYRFSGTLFEPAPAAALAGMERVLDDRRFQYSGAAQIVYDFWDIKPKWCEPEAFEPIFQKAVSICRARRMVMPGE